MDQQGAFTVKEVAAFLRVTPQAIYNMIRREEIPAFKVGSAVRVLRSDLDAYIEKRKRLFAAQNAVYEPSSEDVVSARNICAHFGGYPGGDPVFSIDSIFFEIPKGGTLGIIGASGSGKTLLLKALAGLVPLDAGAFFIGQRRVDGLDAHSRRVGLVFQDYALYPMINGRENIAFPRRIAKEEKSVIDLTVARIAEELGIEKGYLEKRISALPEGIKQLIAIGRAEDKPQKNPLELFLMDEPLLHFDARKKEETRVFLKHLVSVLGATTIYAFNDAADALALSDHLLVLRDGRSAQFGATADVFQKPADGEIMELLSLNGVSSMVGDYSGGAAVIEGLASAVQATLPTAADPAYRGKVSVIFRPEEVVPAAGETGGRESGALRALIEKSVPYDGERILATGLLVGSSSVAPQSSAPRVRFLAPEGADGIVAFRPTAAMAYPIM